MDAQTDHKPSALAKGGKKSGQWLLNHPLGALQLVGVVLLAIIVMQNLEPTSIDLLFWTLVDIPKLFLLVISMVLGALIWEVLRRLLLRRSSTAAE